CINDAVARLGDDKITFSEIAKFVDLLSIGSSHFEYEIQIYGATSSQLMRVSEWLDLKRRLFRLDIVGDQMMHRFQLFGTTGEQFVLHDSACTQLPVVSGTPHEIFPFLGLSQNAWFHHRANNMDVFGVSALLLRLNAILETSVNNDSSNNDAKQQQQRQVTRGSIYSAAHGCTIDVQRWRWHTSDGMVVEVDYRYEQHASTLVRLTVHDADVHRTALPFLDPQHKSAFAVQLLSNDGTIRDDAPTIAATFSLPINSGCRPSVACFDSLLSALDLQRQNWMPSSEWLTRALKAQERKFASPEFELFNTKQNSPESTIDIADTAIASLLAHLRLTLIQLSQEGSLHVQDTQNQSDTQSVLIGVRAEQAFKSRALVSEQECDVTNATTANKDRNNAARCRRISDTQTMSSYLIDENNGRCHTHIWSNDQQHSDQQLFVDFKLDAGRTQRLAFERLSPTPATNETRHERVLDLLELIFEPDNDLFRPINIELEEAIDDQPYSIYINFEATISAFKLDTQTYSASAVRRYRLIGHHHHSLKLDSFHLTLFSPLKRSERHYQLLVQPIWWSRLPVSADEFDVSLCFDGTQQQLRPPIELELQFALSTQIEVIGEQHDDALVEQIVRLFSETFEVARIRVARVSIDWAREQASLLVARVVLLDWPPVTHYLESSEVASSVANEAMQYARDSQLIATNEWAPDLSSCAELGDSCNASSLVYCGATFQCYVNGVLGRTLDPNTCSAYSINQQHRRSTQGPSSSEIVAALRQLMARTDEGPSHGWRGLHVNSNTLAGLVHVRQVRHAGASEGQHWAQSESKLSNELAIEFELIASATRLEARLDMIFTFSDDDEDACATRCLLMGITNTGCGAYSFCGDTRECRVSTTHAMWFLDTEPSNVLSQTGAAHCRVARRNNLRHFVRYGQRASNATATTTKSSATSGVRVGSANSCAAQCLSKRGSSARAACVAFDFCMILKSDAGAGAMDQRPNCWLLDSNDNDHRWQATNSTQQCTHYRARFVAHFEQSVALEFGATTLQRHQYRRIGLEASNNDEACASQCLLASDNEWHCLAFSVCSRSSEPCTLLLFDVTTHERHVSGSAASVALATQLSAVEREAQHSAHCTIYRLPLHTIAQPVSLDTQSTGTRSLSSDQLKMSRAISMQIESSRFGKLIVFGVVEAFVDTQSSNEVDAAAVERVAQVLPDELHQSSSMSNCEFEHCIKHAIESTDRTVIKNLRDNNLLNATATLTLVIERLDTFDGKRWLYVFNVGDGQAVIYHTRADGNQRVEPLVVRGTNLVDSLGRTVCGSSVGRSLRKMNKNEAEQLRKRKRKQFRFSRLLSTCVSPLVLDDDDDVHDNTLGDVARKETIDYNIKSTCKPVLTARYHIDDLRDSIKLIVMGNKRLWRVTSEPLLKTILTTTLCEPNQSPASHLVNIGVSKLQSEAGFDERFHSELVAQTQQTESHLAFTMLAAFKRSAEYEIESLNKKLSQTIEERDRAVTNCNELWKRLNSLMSLTAAAAANGGASAEHLHGALGISLPSSSPDSFDSTHHSKPPSPLSKWNTSSSSVAPTNFSTSARNASLSSTTSSSSSLSTASTASSLGSLDLNNARIDGTGPTNGNAKQQ
ncbi:hypothetical protein GZH46_02828, partial [Fragariocoptes setiger]